MYPPFKSEGPVVLELDQDFEYNKKDYLERTGNVDDDNIGMIQLSSKCS
jgi:hypothetical protein